MLRLKLKIDGKPRSFQQKDISARAMREYFKFYEDVEKEKLSDLETLDEMIDIVCKTFNNPEVNFDNILDGLTAEELAPTLQGVFEQIGEIGAAEGKKVPQK